MDTLLEETLPTNFASEDESIGLEESGTKTASAVITTYALNHHKDTGVRTILVKRSAYSTAGVGKLVEFGPKGLQREFFFRYDPSHTGSFIDSKRKIVGVQREYQSVENEGIRRVQLQSESYVSINNGKVEYTPTASLAGYQKAA